MKTINNIDFGNFEMKLHSANKSQFGLALTRYLKSLTYEKRELLWCNIEETVNNLDIQYTKMLSRKDIMNIACIHEIGVHSYSHESMGISTNEFFEDDFFKCQEYFTSILEIPLKVYAFPSGSYRKEQISFLQDNGIENILLVNDMYSSNNSSVHNRFTFYGDSVSEIKMRALGWTR
jgi:peptidoglycan/xylan/chitin deacetylase (PgdA/CDA1 family)